MCVDWVTKIIEVHVLTGSLVYILVVVVVENTDHYYSTRKFNASESNICFTGIPYTYHL